MARTRARGAAPRTGPPRAPSGRWGRAEAGSPRLGLSGGRRWRASSAAIELASPGPEAGLRGIVGGDVGDACCAQFFVGFLFLFSFSYKKKKKRTKKSGFHGVGVRVLLCRQAEGRPDGARSGGARAASPRRKAHCAGVGPGGRGPGAASPRLFIQLRTDGSLCRLREGRGLHGYPGGLGKSAPLHPPADRTPRSLAVPISWCPGVWLKNCSNWAGRGRGCWREAGGGNRIP